MSGHIVVNNNNNGGSGSSSSSSSSNGVMQKGVNAELQLEMEKERNVCLR